MEGMFIGEYIREKRKELGYSQAKLCDGICEPITLSRFERGKQMPSRDKIRDLLRRLGLPEEYAYFPTKDEIVIDGLQKDIISCNVHHDQENGLKKIEMLEKIAQKENKQIRQFILRSKVLLGKPDGEYSFSEKLDMLINAIQLTSPNFDISKIQDGLYTIEEIKIINQLGLIHSRDDKHEEAADAFGQLLEYINMRYDNVGVLGGCFPMISYNYALELSKLERYEESLKNAEAARDFCIHHGHYQFLPGSIVIMAKCHHFLGDDEQSRQLYQQAYILYKALGDERNAQNAKESAMEYLGIELLY